MVLLLLVLRFILRRKLMVRLTLRILGIIKMQSRLIINDHDDRESLVPRKRSWRNYPKRIHCICIYIHCAGREVEQYLQLNHDNDSQLSMISEILGNMNKPPVRNVCNRSQQKRTKVSFWSLSAEYGMQKTKSAKSVFGSKYYIKLFLNESSN